LVLLVQHAQEAPLFFVKIFEKFIKNFEEFEVMKIL